MGPCAGCIVVLPRSIGSAGRLRRAGLGA